jgi:biotin carboxylase
MPTIWYNQGYSVVRDAIQLVREGAEAAGVSDLRLLASHADFQANVLEEADLGFLEPAGLRGDEEGDAAYAAWCADRCRELGVDLFIVQGGQSAIATHRHLFPDATRVVLPATAERLAQIHDKGVFHQIATQAGIPMAWSMTVGNARDFDAALQQLEARGLAPCIKPREGVFGAGFWRLDERYDLLEALMGGDRRRVSAAVMRDAIAAADRPVRLLAMEYLPGPEWSLDCICDEGRLVVGVARRKRGRVQELETEGPIFAMAEAAIATFALSGQINVQFKAADEDGGDPRLLEINPRMSGGMARTRFAGVNLPWRHVALLLGLEPPAEQPAGGALIATQEIGYTVGGRAREVGHV